VFYFQTRVDPVTGKWQFQINVHGKTHWSAPMTAAQLDKVVRVIHSQRVDSGKGDNAVNLDAKALDVDTILRLGLLSATKVPPSDKTLQKIEERKRTNKLRGMDADAILRQLGPISFDKESIEATIRKELSDAS
jgi:hypothetical protein